MSGTTPGSVYTGPDLAALVEASGTTFVLAMFVDLRGKPCAKLVPASAVPTLVKDGAGFAGYAVGAIGQQPSDPDLIAVPDATSFTPIPFVKPGLALVHCDPTVNGEPWPFAPRVILRSVLARAAERSLKPYVGAEVEYFLLKRGIDGTIGTADPDDRAAQPCYDARGLTRMYDHLTSISSAMNALGWANYANDHEDANGQFEQNFAYADAMTTADRVITLRYLLSVLAAEQGRIATFMPKPFADRTGSGLHLHLSLRRTDPDGQESAVFPDDDDPRQLGLSRTAYSFLGGVLEHAKALQLVLGPTVNSYKRTGAPPPASGASWSPGAISYGGNDRTHYVRVPDGQRIELRGGDASANPYLAIAGAVAAGLDGIERDQDPGEVGAVRDEPLPRTLLQAVEAFRADALLGGVLDAAGPGVADYFADLKQQEFLDWHATVSPWEIENYLEAF